MLSTLAVRKGAPSLSKFINLAANFAKRGCATAVVAQEDGYQYLPNEELIPHHKPYPVTIEQQMQHWDEANEIFFGKDRDFKNFPHPEYVVDSPSVNFGMVPTSWCMNIYEKLGVSGVYTVVLGSIAACMNKEWLFADAHGYELFIRCAVFTWFLSKVGPIAKKSLNDAIQRERVDLYEEPLEKAKVLCASNIEVAKNSIWRMEAVSDIYAAKKEMVDLQLESIYRQRLFQVHKEVKEKLDYQVDMISLQRSFQQANMDYQVDMISLQRSFQQANMVSWIVGQVQKSITPQMEKENIKSCIANLATLAKKA